MGGVLFGDWVWVFGDVVVRVLVDVVVCEGVGVLDCFEVVVLRIDVGFCFFGGCVGYCEYYVDVG